MSLVYLIVLVRSALSIAAAAVEVECVAFCVLMCALRANVCAEGTSERGANMCMEIRALRTAAAAGHTRPQIVCVCVCVCVCVPVCAKYV